MHRRTVGRAAGLPVAALAMILAAGCSSSSSSGPPSAGGGSSAPGSQSSSGPAPKPTHTKTPNAGGPAGTKTQVTTPTTVAPTKGAIGGSVVIPHVAANQRKHLSAELAKLPGVRNITYYTNFKQLQVYFTDAATQDQKAAVLRAASGG